MLSPPSQPFREELHELVHGDWQTPDQLLPGTEEKREWPFSLHPFPWIDQSLSYGKYPLVYKQTKAGWEILEILGKNLLTSHRGYPNGLLSSVINDVNLQT